MNEIRSLSSLKNQFLIAMPQMDSSGFANSLIYLCEHDTKGAMGIVVNRPMGIALVDIFEQLEIQSELEAKRATPIFAGGPVETNRGFILHRSAPSWEASIDITEAVSLTTSRDILSAIARGDGPQDWLVALGYSGWGAGQLEQEVANNYWLTVPADHEIIFKTPYEQRLEAAAGLLGISLAQLSTVAGHA